MIIALDLETTGLDRTQDFIIEVALVKIDEKTLEVLDTYQTLINPGIPIPDISSNITGIFDEDVADAPTFSEVSAKIQAFISDTPVLGHNVKFDKDFLVYNGIQIEKNIFLDTFLLANFLLPYERSLSLEHLSGSLKIKLEGSHRAMNDTLATVELFKYLVKEINKQSLDRLKIFSYISSKSDDESFDYIASNYIKKDLGEGINKKQDFIDVLLKKVKQISNKQEIIQDSDRKKQSFESMMSNVVGLELRTNQSEMSGLVHKNLYEGGKIVIEAPTGIGKTFAYLLPSIDFSIRLGEQVYVSTTTKALQDQIFYKDLKFLEENLEDRFSYSKLKGKINYIGIQAFFDFLFSHDSFDRLLTPFFLKISFWLFETKYGELDELNYYGEEFYFLSKINANNPHIFNTENTFYTYEFLIKARYKAKNSNIVVINNNILFQDILSENNILGEVKNVVLDEAHNLEDVLTSSLKKSFSWDDLERIFVNIERILDEHNTMDPLLKQKREQLLFDIGNILGIFQDYIFSKVSQDSKYKRVLVKKDFFLDNDSTGAVLSTINQSFSYLFESFEGLSDDIYMLLGKELQFLEDIQKILSIVLSQRDNEIYIPMVSFYEKKGVIVEYTVLNPGEFLEKNLWHKLNSITLTSATLKTKGNFDYVKNMYSLSEFNFFELETDFDYSKQALLFLPNDLGNIKKNFSEVSQFLQDFVLLVKGSMLILFTSFFSIETFYKDANLLFKKNNIQLLAQSIGGGKHKQVEAFKKNSTHSVLVGTDTFWQGIDISGDDLKYLVIHKIPFTAPSDPIFQARSELFKDSFGDYAIPKSILKLKQGFGRLIRTKKDTGIVVFLDNRILSTKWGQDFFSAFPENINMKVSSKDKLLHILSS